jgi:hypothetical protein
MPDSTWLVFYRTALAESDPRKLESRIEAARRSVHQCLRELEDSGDTRGRQQLTEALYALQTLPARRRSA